jgi:formylglycine-generating enzyme required for sulfatase activity
MLPVALLSLLAHAGETYSAWPFDAAEAQRRQAETAKANNLPVVMKVPVGSAAINFRLIPPGKFMLGSPDSENGHEGDERLRAEVIAEPFYMMETQLTVEHYRALLKEDPADGNENDLPAGIPYRDTIDKVLPALAKFAPDGWKVILSDQTRLEYAARAGIATMNPGGNAPEDAEPFAWYDKNSGRKVHPVAQKKPNPWGLYDVIGNRWHWFWRAGAGYGDASTKDHIVYGGSYNSPSGGNGVRLANIMISSRFEGARFALIRAETALPKGHPETKVAKK